MPTTNGCLTNYAEQRILNKLLNNDSDTWSLPTVHLALWQGSPTDTGGGSSEVATPGANGYNRVALSGKWGSGAASRSISTTTAPTGDITFGPCSGSAWGTVEYWALFDDATAGNMLAYGDLTTATVSPDDSYKIGGTNFTIAFTAGSKWSDGVLNSILNHLVGYSSWSTPDYYLALYEGDPLGAGSETHTAGNNGYSRVQIHPKMGAASGGSITNDTAIDYGPASGASWGVADYYAVMSASTAGSVIGGAALTASKTINDGDSAQFAISALSFTMD